LDVDAVVTNDVAAARRALGRSELPDAAPPRSVPPPAAG
jgi:hypothetical protein